MRQPREPVSGSGPPTHPRYREPPAPRRKRRNPTGKNARRKKQLQVTVATTAGWFGFTLGLLNVYPSLYPWRTHADKILGIAICGLTAVLGSRITYLTAEGKLDVPAALLTITLLVVIGLTAILVSSAA